MTNSSGRRWLGIGDCNRAVSTVADVTLALLMIVAAMGVLVTFADTTEKNHEPIATDYMAETITASTINTSYSLVPALKAHYQAYVGSSNHPYDEDDLQRLSHGPLASHIASIVVTKAAFDNQQLSRAADEYQRVVDEALQASLVGSRFGTNVQAVWTPVENSSIRGNVELGQTPPPRTDVSTTTITVTSGMRDVRAEAIDAVEDDDHFEVVAEIVASAVIEGYVPELETQRALESSGVEFDLTVYRYKRLATVIEDADPDKLDDQGWLAPPTADAVAAKEYLSDKLAAQLEADLREAYENAQQAARAVSTGHVTITIRTWTHD